MNHTPFQRSLFPDAFEVEADALEALEDLAPERGLASVREARRRDPLLPNLDELEEALGWLREVLGNEPADCERAAAAFLTLPHAGLARGAAEFADQALARFGLRRAEGAFLGAEERVPLAALRLVLDQKETARHELAGLLGGREERADLWGWRGDACALGERPEEAQACYARALLLDASRADLFRLREPRLRALLAELRAAHPEPCARELLFVHAWLRGLLDVPAENTWLDVHVARLRAETVVGEEARPHARPRRFALLLYLDRSRPAGGFDLAEREEMAALDPELFRRVVAVLREREAR